MLLIVGAFLLMLRLEVEFIVVASIVDVSKTRSKHLIFFFFFSRGGAAGYSADYLVFFILFDRKQIRYAKIARTYLFIYRDFKNLRITIKRTEI